MRFVSKNGEDSVKVLDIMLFKIHEFKKEDVTDFTIKWELHKGGQLHMFQIWISMLLKM